MQIQLPKLKKSNSAIKKNKILLLSDDLKFHSGVATVSREIVVGTSHKYDWVQLAAALKHPEHGKRIDLSEAINKESNITNANVIQYCHTGYGDQNVLREIIEFERPNLILLITDPRFFGFVFQMEHEIRTHYKIPIAYLNIWDQASPFPHWNAPFYASCDLLMAINKGTKVVNSEVLRQNGYKCSDIDNTDERDGTLLSYVPHGSSTKYYYPQNDKSPDWQEFLDFKTQFELTHDCDFVVLYNNRNIRRKQPADVILAFKMFCDKLPKAKSKKCCLFMKTSVIDENGTDLMAVKRIICPDYKVIFNDELLPINVLNWIYNISDVVFYMSSAEGFGLAANEALMCGRLITAPVTGGLQDQMRFEDADGNWVNFDSDFTSNHRGTYKKCGEWAFPIWPRARQLQGSVPTPYIFDDVCDAADAANNLYEIYNLTPEERFKR
ncbi:MAG: glycosyltransferase family 1 protein, partial [Flavobacteriaceae bacterium]|nr:glycosyltransferase family 1 protein [Flavobacteriaceae bacterium]